MAVALAVVAGGCGGSAGSARTEPAPVPSAVGLGPRYRPAPYGRAVAAAAPVGGLRCTRAAPLPRFGVHVELFARGRLILLPAGVGVAPPQRRRGVYVAAGRCSYSVRTHAPTGVVEVERDGAPATLGTLFSLWGQPLAQRRLAGFRAPPGRHVVAFVDGRRWTGDPRTIPLRRHAEIYLAVGDAPPPHASYRFPPGL